MRENEKTHVLGGLGINISAYDYAESMLMLLLSDLSGLAYFDFGSAQWNRTMSQAYEARGLPLPYQRECKLLVNVQAKSVRRPHESCALLH